MEGFLLPVMLGLLLDHPVQVRDWPQVCFLLNVWILLRLLWWLWWRLLRLRLRFWLNLLLRLTVTATDGHGVLSSFLSLEVLDSLKNLDCSVF